MTTQHHTPNVRRTSKRLSWLLRHGAGESGLKMTEAGWASLDDVRAALRCSRETIQAAVEHNNKSRFQVRDGLIRASQGHSREGMPVTREALEASWTRYVGDGLVWHGTHVDAVEGIARDGIHSGGRTHVHLAAALDSRVGKRANVHVMLGADPASMRARGVELFESPNGVVLARRVPAECLVSLRAMTRRAREEEARLRALLGLREERPRS